MDPSSSSDKMAEVRSLLREGNKIAAIKEYRSITGVGLAEAKEAVESMPLDPSAPPSADLPTNVAQKSGCLGLLAISASLALAGWWLFA
jgi:hypothetical protein